MDDELQPLPAPPDPPRRRRAWTKRLSIALGIPQRLVQKVLKWPNAPDWPDDQVDADFDRFEATWRRYLAVTWPRFRGLRPSLAIEPATPASEHESPGIGSAGGVSAPGDELHVERLARIRADRQMAELKLAQMRGSVLPRAEVTALMRDVLLITASVIRDHPAWLAEAMPTEHRAALRAVARAVESRAIAEQKARVTARWKTFIAAVSVEGAPS